MTDYPISTRNQVKPGASVDAAGQCWRSKIIYQSCTDDNVSREWRDRLRINYSGLITKARILRTGSY